MPMVLLARVASRSPFLRIPRALSLGSRYVGTHGVDAQPLATQPYVERKKVVLGHEIPEPVECSKMPRKFRSASNDVLSILAAQGSHGARKERLLREIMYKDDCTWPEAREKLYEINRVNDRFGLLFQAPFYMGIVLGVGGGFGCIPLVFHRDAALWFNELFVHEELPDDLSNFWQVGEWTWGWMEPFLGTASFTLLAMQFTRQFLIKLRFRPYSDLIDNHRADRLAGKYSQYEREIVRDFAKSDSWVDTARKEHRHLVEQEIAVGKSEDRQAAKAQETAYSTGAGTGEGAPKAPSSSSAS